MSERTCENCRYNLQTTSTGVSGECRRHPPTGGQKGYGSWPSADSTYWCGEWADKAITPEQEQRRDLVRRFVDAILASGRDCMMHEVWHMAAVVDDLVRVLEGE